MELTGAQLQHINTLSDAELRQWVQDDAYRAQMIAYFGAEEYTALREILAVPPRFAGTGAEVIVLPGIMGSDLNQETRRRNLSSWPTVWEG
ncbi:MAG: hypothetical protein FJZ47_24820 [Candidatus Tectomicrobia bacterium]|uniref:Uncharacterized protein n=1 Tax=Tectimicrobiota bacterium TaxID=2528274 RepID=A0A937W6D3_UNCTE|nr:hypothetical protein [Candidatus Tectomicrobia bacterium]